MQLALGAVYAWSVFREPLVKTFGWSISQVTLTFSISIFVLGFAAFVGGLWMRRAGPRVVGMTAGVVYGIGVAAASLSANKLWVLYLSYGLLGGIGLGLGYIVPVATRFCAPSCCSATAAGSGPCLHLPLITSGRKKSARSTA